MKIWDFLWGNDGGGPMLAVAGEEYAAAGSRHFIEGLANAFTQGLTQVIGTISEDAARRLSRPFSYSVTWVDLIALGLFVLVVWLVNILVLRYLRRLIRKGEGEKAPNSWRVLLIEAVRKPLYLLIWIYGVYFAVVPVLVHLPGGEEMHPLRWFFAKIFDLGIFASLVWFFFRFIHVLEVRLEKWSEGTRSMWDDFLVPLIGRSLRVIIPLIAVIMALPLVGLSQEHDEVVQKAVTLLIIGTVAWVLIQAVVLSEKTVLDHFDITGKDNLRARTVYTQVHVLKKTALVVIGIFTVACALMTFDEVRRLGASILASAGIAGIILGFAAQRTLSNLFAGIQIAFTQPIRLDDVVIVEGEWGRIEEISLTYVVVKIWDLRRLVVPISYFIEKPFRNWTRVSADILGSVMLFADYTLPFEEIRAEAGRIVEGCKDWDRKFWNMQVTDATERTVQIRILATAADASLAWNLRCEIREKLIAYIQQKFPESLPRMRTELDDLDKLARLDGDTKAQVAAGERK